MSNFAEMTKWDSYNCLYLPKEHRSVDGFLSVSFLTWRLAHRWMALSQYITVKKINTYESIILLIYKVILKNMSIIFIKYSFWERDVI
jgi:hypothetical protein